MQEAGAQQIRTVPEESTRRQADVWIAEVPAW